MKLTNKKFKKLALPLAIAGTLSLAGCGSQVEQTYEENNTIVTEATTEEVTTEVATVEEIKETIEEKEDYYTMAANSYNKYTAFYCETGMAYADENADQGINISKIENMFKLIKGDVSDLTESEIEDACECLNYVLLSQNLSTNLHDVIDEELGYITIEGNITLSDVPSISEYLTDEETKEVVANYETLRNQVQNDLNTTNRVSEQTKEALRNAVIDMEYDYLPDENDMNGIVYNESQKLVENYAKKNLVDLTVLATNESRLQTELFPGGLKIAPETDQERDVQSKALIHGLDILTDSEKELYSTMTMELVGQKYLDGICTNQEEIKKNAIDHNEHSKIDLNNQKEMLLKQKEILQSMLEQANEDVQVKIFC